MQHVPSRTAGGIGTRYMRAATSLNLSMHLMREGTLNFTLLGSCFIVCCFFLVSWFCSFLLGVRKKSVSSSRDPYQATWSVRASSRELSRLIRPICFQGPLFRGGKKDNHRFLWGSPTKRTLSERLRMVAKSGFAALGVTVSIETMGLFSYLQGHLFFQGLFGGATWISSIHSIMFFCFFF